MDGEKTYLRVQQKKFMLCHHLLAIIIIKLINIFCFSRIQYLTRQVY